MSATAEMQAEALSRAAGGISMSNYPAIFHGFAAKGIAEQDIEPRVNVFTYQAWQALGRQVKKGEHGVKLTTWIQRGEEHDAAGNITRKGCRFARTVTVFHVSQTEQIAPRG